MSGYYRISKLKGCLSSLKNVKNISKLNDTLSKEIDALCSKTKNVQDSTGSFGKIKELNQLLTKEFSAVTTKIKSGSNTVLNLAQENVSGYKNKLEETCRPLYTVPHALEEKKEQYKRKYLKPKHIKKEAAKLCQHLARRQVYGSTLAWSASGLSLKEDTANTVIDAASKTAEDTKTVLPKSVPSDTLMAPTQAEPEGSAEGLLDPIPEPPPIPDLSTEALNQVNALGEATFASLGLGGWTPVGIVQNCMEYLHVTMGIDWWVAIVLGTLVIRICLFPLVVLAQRNAAKMNNYLPQMQSIQLKLTEARQTGDSLNAARYSQELMLFMKEKGLNPLKNMIVPLAQAPIFVSFFMGLRQMANVPVDSLRHGGIFWFNDLTLPDQYFILPCVTSFTLWLTIELGTDSAKLSAQNMNLMKYVLRGIPIVLLPFTVNFPGAILCYWVSSNFISLGQVMFLRIPKVRDYFNIEQMLTFKPDQLPNKPKGFKEGIKDSWTNIKITRELEERRKLDEMQFRRAGKGPVQKTFKYDPTKQEPPGTQSPMSAKNR